MSLLRTHLHSSSSDGTSGGGGGANGSGALAEGDSELTFDESWPNAYDNLHALATDMAETDLAHLNLETTGSGDFQQVVWCGVSRVEC